MYITLKINNIAKKADFSINSSIMMEFGSPDAGEDDEFNGIDFVVIQKLFAMLNAFVFQAAPLDRV